VHSFADHPDFFDQIQEKFDRLIRPVSLHEQASAKSDKNCAGVVGELLVFGQGKASNKKPRTVAG
jgi:hypothetical protein